jgi:hypothetical protein
MRNCEYGLTAKARREMRSMMLKGKMKVTSMA